MTLLILICAGGASWYLLFNQPSEEYMINTQLNKLLELCVKNNSESVIVIGMKNSQLSNMFAPTCSVAIKEMIMNGSYTPMELAAAIIKARFMFKTLKGSISDIEITLAADKKSAIIDYSLNLSAQRKQGQSYNDTRELHSELQKIDDVWRFASFEIRKILEK